MRAPERSAVVLTLAGAMLFTAGARPALAQCEQAELTASNPARNDGFGFSVAMSGDRALVGAWKDDDGCTGDPDCDTGSAFVYRREGESWLQEAKLTAPDPSPGDWFGGGVALDADLAVAGADQEDGPAGNEGAAYVFRRSGVSWSLEQKLTASDRAQRDYFGTPAASGDLIVVGASGKKCADGSIVCGAAYVYRYDGGTWVEEQQLISSDRSTGDAFAISVATDGDRIVAGAWGDDDGCPPGENCRTGSAYVFAYDPGLPGWVEEAKLVASDPEAEDRFGFSVAVDCDRIVVGSFYDDDGCPPGENCNSGAAYVFRYQAGAWVEEAKLTASDAPDHPEFGRSARITANLVLVGAVDQAYAFVRNGLQWTEAAWLAPLGVEGDKFGYEVAMSGDYAIAGAPWTDGVGLDSGAAYVFRLLGAPDLDSDGINDYCQADCNGNGIRDDLDIAAGTSDDCNGNGVPDECEPDCNLNGVADSCDIAGGTSADCAGEGIPDECEPDCNGNGAADSCDILGGTSQDCTGNHVPDECEPDCDQNGSADSCDIAGGSSADCNGNAVPDACDIASATSDDCTGNEIPDECEPDCNANGTADSCDIADETSADLDQDGIPDECENWTQCQTEPAYFDFTPHRFDPEAEQLAMNLSGALRAPEYEYQRIRGDLQLVRAAYPVLEGVEHEPHYAPDQLLVSLEAGGPWPEYEQMNLYYQAVSDVVVGGDINKVTFCDNLNAEVLQTIYAGLPGVSYAQPNYIYGTLDDQITIDVNGSTYRYTIVDGFHDCFDGCDCERIWVIDVAADGTLTLISYQEDDHGWSWCVFEDTACCLPDASCSAMAIAPCQNQGGAPLAFEAVCEGDADGDGVDATCGDQCPDDQNKLDPGVCGCGVPDMDRNGDGTMDCIETIPSSSGWGLALMSLLILSAGMLYVGAAPRKLH